MATKFLGTLKVVPKLVASDRKIGRAHILTFFSHMLNKSIIH